MNGMESLDNQKFRKKHLILFSLEKFTNFIHTGLTPLTKTRSLNSRIKKHIKL